MTFAGSMAGFALSVCERTKSGTKSEATHRFCKGSKGDWTMSWITCSLQISVIITTWNKPYCGNPEMAHNFVRKGNLCWVKRKAQRLVHRDKSA